MCAPLVRSPLCAASCARLVVALGSWGGSHLLLLLLVLLLPAAASCCCSCCFLLLPVAAAAAAAPAPAPPPAAAPAPAPAPAVSLCFLMRFALYAPPVLRAHPRLFLPCAHPCARVLIRMRNAPSVCLCFLVLPCVSLCFLVLPCVSLCFLGFPWGQLLVFWGRPGA